MKVKLTIDAGTSNSRIRAWDMKNHFVTEMKTSYGVKIGKNKFKEELENSVKEILEKNNFQCDNIIASGMITSPLGLLEVPHIGIPASDKELRSNLKEIEFLNMKMYLIPGLKAKKKFLGKYDLNQIDIIRGEEAEIVGVVKLLEKAKDSVVILPGSHNKFIELDSEGKIVDFSSTLSGEILAALIKDTIMSSSISVFADKMNEKFLKIGFEAAREFGFSEAVFVTRGMDLSNKLINEEKFSYLLGVILYEDLISLEKNFLSKKNRVIVAGKGNIAAGLVSLLKTYYPKIEVIQLESQMLSPLGALEIGKEVL